MRRKRRPYQDPHAPFETKEEWELFCDAMRRLRDPNTPMIARHHLLRIGEDIEARQRTKGGWNGYDRP